MAGTDGRTRDLTTLLHAVARARGPLGAAEADALARMTGDDPVPAAFCPGTPAAVLERARLLRRAWGPFAAWWRSYFPGADAPDPPITELWRLYLPFARWIAAEKRLRRPDGVFVVGFNGSPGAGKTVLTHALAVVLDRVLVPGTEGRAVARSGDDWYLGRDRRERLRALGYDPGVPGVPNRSLPGTHDLAWLKRNLREMERGDPHAVIRMGNFDKRADDQPTGPERYFEVRGRVGVFLFDLWFAGARTDAAPGALPDGLRRRVAEALGEWRDVFARMDALWAFDWPSVEQMVREREEQERLVERRRGARGLSGAHVRAFMDYMILRGWDWRTTSPVPPESAVTFHARRDAHHRVVAVRKGGRVLP